MKRMSSDPAMRDAAFEHNRRMMDMAQLRYEGKREGLAEGIEKGIEQGIEKQRSRCEKSAGHVGNRSETWNASADKIDGRAGASPGKQGVYATCLQR